MRILLKCTLIAAAGFVLNACSSTKVLAAWLGEEDDVEAFKEKNVLVVARTADDHARIAFEEAITNELKAEGIQATESFKKIPRIHPNREITEERVAMMQSILASEGYDGIVLTVVKDKSETTYVNQSRVGVGVGYGSYYPGHYGSFYDYYAYPYASGPYYSSFGGSVPVSTTVNTYTTYVLETVAYNLDESGDNQLVAVVTSELKDPKNAYKEAREYAAVIMKSLKR
jgi:hypothetical protein